MFVTQMRQPDDDPQIPHESLGLPQDNGWSTWDVGRCSVTRCLDEPVAAIKRARGPRRPARFQPYCAAHAHARGVQCVDGVVVWTADFLSTMSSDRATRARRDSNP